MSSPIDRTRRRAARWLVAAVAAPIVVASPAVIDAASTAAVATDSTSVAADTSGTPRPLGPGEARYIVRTNGLDALGGVAARLSALGVAEVDRLERAMTALVVQGRAERVAALAKVPGVVSVEMVRPVSVAGTQFDPPNWGLDRIDQRLRTTTADRPSFRFPASGVGVTVYVVDTGVRSTHEQFAGRINMARSYAYNFGDGRLTAEDCHGHGTQVASVAGGTKDGVAKGVTLVAVKVLDCSGNGDDSTVAAGIDWIIKDHTPGQPAVANMSFAGPASPALDASVAALVADGVTVVVAAGNQGSDVCTYSPSRLASAITVGAVDSSDVGASFSNHGACTDVLAPGVSIRTASMWADSSKTVQSDTAERVDSGTSFAAPHVAGVAAIVLQRSPSMTPAQVWASLDASSTKGVISEQSGDPDKLIYVDQFVAVAPWSSGFNPFDAPIRLIDTRVNEQGDLEPGDEVRKFAAGEIRRVSMAGLPADATVVLNIVTVAPDAPGHITVYPCTSALAPRPPTSFLNFRAGSNLANEGLVGIGSAGGICVSAYTGLHLVIDSVGWIPAGATYTALAAPIRVFDTRPTPDGVEFRGVLESSVDEATPFGAGEVRRYVPLGAGSLPATGVTALAVNIVSILPATSGELSIYPCDSVAEVPPSPSTVAAYAAGVTVAAGAVLRVSASGGFCVRSSGVSHVLVDATGWFGPTGALRSFAAPSYPVRMLDTRAGLSGPAETPDVATPLVGSRTGATMFRFAGVAGIPSAPTAHVLAVSITTRGATAAGHLTVWACSSTSDPAPATSVINYNPGVDTTNLVIVPLSADLGAFCVRAYSTVDVTMDVSSWFERVP